MKVTVAEIEALNKEIKGYNIQAQQKQGEKKAAQKAVEESLKQYNKKYETDLTIEGLQEEYNKVYKDLVQDYLKAKEQIEHIKEQKVNIEDIEPVIDYQVTEQYVKDNIDKELIESFMQLADNEEQESTTTITGDIDKNIEDMPGDNTIKLKGWGI